MSRPLKLTSALRIEHPLVWSPKFKKFRRTEQDLQALRKNSKFVENGTLRISTWK